MRLEVDPALAKLLDSIKAKEPTIYGRGHAETVRFLAEYYTKHKPLEELIDDLRIRMTRYLLDIDEKMQQSLERVFPKALANVISTILLSTPKETPNSQKRDPDVEPGSQEQDAEKTQTAESTPEIYSSRRHSRAVRRTVQP